MSNKRRTRKPLGAGADVADAAELVLGILRLPETGGKDAMCALAQSYTGRPDVLGVAVI
jgi:hypothetical protein